MINVFKSEEGRDEIRQTVRDIYSRCTVAAESRFLDTGEFGDTHVLINGTAEKPPLILLHGTSSNSATWYGYLPEWFEHFHIFALDIPGQPGLSSEFRPLLGDGSMRRWLSSSVAELGLEKFYLCGMSMGGWISLDYSFRHPESVLGMGLFAPGGLAPFRSSFFLKILPLALLGDTGVRRINRLIHGRVPIHPEIDSFTVLVSKHFLQLDERVPIFGDEDLQGIGFPLIYFGGVRDPLLNTRRSSERLRRLVPEAEIVILEGISHVILDQGEAFLRFFT